MFKKKLNTLLRYQETFRFFTDQDSPYIEGEIFYNKGLSNTLELIAEKGGKAFYEVDIADKIAEFMKQEG
ncbi:gamma-glutamyltransferase [Staphylococcus sp. NAM3COL9]|uniref:gamma-glutamyltransferase n=1 Tax=Staphylococcus sp. NAM3COL9 TaxID=1667172 RepID=UPI00346240F6